MLPLMSNHIGRPVAGFTPTYSWENTAPSPDLPTGWPTAMPGLAGRNFNPLYKLKIWLSILVMLKLEFQRKPPLSTFTVDNSNSRPLFWSSPTLLEIPPKPLIQRIGWLKSKSLVLLSKASTEPVILFSKKPKSKPRFSVLLVSQLRPRLAKEEGTIPALPE